MGQLVDFLHTAVLHENMADEAQLRALSWTLAVEPRVRIGRRGVRLVRALLAAEVDLGVASFFSRGLACTNLRRLLCLVSR